MVSGPARTTHVSTARSAPGCPARAAPAGPGRRPRAPRRSGRAAASRRGSGAGRPRRTRRRGRPTGRHGGARGGPARHVQLGRQAGQVAEAGREAAERDRVVGAGVPADHLGLGRARSARRPRRGPARRTRPGARPAARRGGLRASGSAQQRGQVGQRVAGRRARCARPGPARPAPGSRAAASRRYAARTSAAEPSSTSAAPQPTGRSITSRGLDQLDQDAAGVLRVHEVDQGAGGAAPRRCRRAAAGRARAASPPPPRRPPRCRPPAARPGPDRSRNFAIAESGRSGASSWMRVSPSPTASIASRTPCSSLISSCTACRPKVRAYQAIASSRSATAMPTWSMRREHGQTVRVGGRPGGCRGVTAGRRGPPVKSA